jgi:hypothetical protein
VFLVHDADYKELSIRSKNNQYKYESITIRVLNSDLIQHKAREIADRNNIMGILPMGKSLRGCCLVTSIQALVTTDLNES